MSAIATSGLPCMAAVTAAREARIFHCTAARRTPASADAAPIESAARATSPERS